ncbi:MULTISPECIES: metallophosphoesterase [unclassified Bradyrhizobium]|uniref:metallophosphoesterase n=1 Tax=unclassified Bradyrhizobium TaxID=2631580 RepID=UPI002915C711|nr:MULTISPECIES: metallophosphoesterase [unclassified Bradyrhizobium]
MLLWILSDLHFELCRGWDLPVGHAQPQFDVLVVAGDLVTRMERGVELLRRCVIDRPVVYVAGNHEFYGCDIDRTVEKARQAAADTNVHVLQNDAVVINGVLFIGATFWTDFALYGNPELAMRRAADEMNDYRKIRKNGYTERLRPKDTLIRHLESRRFFAQAIREAQADRIVVVTHHGCVRETLRRGSEADILSSAYVSDCPDLLGSVNLWVYGHTHEGRDFTIGQTRIVSNAKGYGPWRLGGAWENPRFDPRYVIEI